MFHPVGSQPPSVYWRRRLLLVAAVVVVLVLIVLTAKAIAGGGDTAAAGSTPPHSTSAPLPTTSHVPTTHPASSPPASRSSSAPARSSSKPATSGAASSTAPMPAACTAANLTVSAVVGQKTYTTSDQPVLALQVVNTGSAPCIQDLADKQVELKVYNGVSRVWGSHDCAIQPGTAKRTLAVNTPVKVAIPWSEKTSSKGCQDRQKVGAGTYTLYAYLAGKTGKAAQFTIN
jgi:hypothetical protein